MAFKDDDIIREAEKIMEIEGIKNALNDLREYLMEEVAQTAKCMYDELLEAGFSKEQAHDITKAYVLDYCRLRWVKGESTDESEV